MRKKLFVVGISGSGFMGVTMPTFREILGTCGAIVGSDRQVKLLKSQVDLGNVSILNWNDGTEDLLQKIAIVESNVLILSSGDPGYFGTVRLLQSRLPDFELSIYPVPSSVSIAFARARTSWEDALVISAHGRAYKEVLKELLKALEPDNSANKLAILCSPEHPPQFIAQLLIEAGSSFQRYIVCTKLESPEEVVFEGELEILSKCTFDPYSILLAIRESGADRPSVSNSHADKTLDPEFVHRRKMITKPEVREVIFAKLLPYISGGSKCLWDLGAGSGSVGISAARKVEGLRLFLIEKDPIQIRLIELNSTGLANLTIVQGKAQEVVQHLPHPDAIFIGGGGLDVLNSVKEHLEKPTFVIASYASISRATEAADQLGNLMQVSLPIGKRLKDKTWRLEADNPVFLSWGLLR